LAAPTGLPERPLQTDHALRQASRPPVQDWVTREVLPAIRKTGVYITDEVRAQHPEAVAEFEARLVAKLPDADVWTSLNRFLKAKGIELPMRDYWMAVGQLTERTKTKNAKRFGRLNHDTLLFSVAELEAGHTDERAYPEAA
jgi:hypothetical protein